MNKYENSSQFDMKYAFINVCMMAKSITERNE